MKKLLALLLVVFAAFSLVGCGGDAIVESISISGQETEFEIGETFNQGDLKVIAKLSDGTEIDITNQIKVEQNVDTNTAGTYAVLISYNGFYTAYEVKVNAKEPEATLIKIDVDGAKSTFTVGDVFESTGLKVTATMSDGTTKDVTADAKITQSADMNTTGKYAVVVSYEGQNAVYEIVVNALSSNATLQSINVTGAKTEFVAGDTFATTGLVVTANFSDGSTQNVTDKALVTQNADMNVAGKYAVVVSYAGQNAVYEITVAAKAFAESIAISGQKTEFTVGDTFEATDLKVTATMSDGTTKDVTADAKITQNADMNTAGKYAVVVEYADKKVIYEISVIAKENVKTLDKIAVDADSVKTLYELGDSLSIEGLKVYEYFKNSEFADSIEVITDFANYSIKVVDANGNEVSTFSEYGVYTVIVANGEVNDTYEINVGAYVYDTILEAIKAGLANADKVDNGKVLEYSGTELFNTLTYQFGDNYTKVYDGYSTYHYEMLDEETVFGVNESSDYYTGEPMFSPAYDPIPEFMLGVDLRNVFGYTIDIYGAEQLIDNLYTIGKEDTSMNYNEEFTDVCTICGLHHSYSFSYEFVSDGYYYYYVEVSFSLNDDQIFENINANIYGYYTYNMDYNEETETYTLKPEITEYDFDKTYVVEQFVGERNAVNPYSAATTMIKSFEITDAEGNILKDGDTVTTKVQQPLVYTVANILPETAKPSVDEIKISITDADGNEVWTVYGSYYDGELSLSPYAIGEFYVTVYTLNTELSLTLKVDYADIQYINGACYDASYMDLVETSEVELYAGATLQFGAIVNNGANPGYTISLQNGDGDVTIAHDGSYDTFVAAVPGTYTILFTSIADESITATLTIIVSEAPSVAEILNGKYTMYSAMMGTITVEFTPASEGATNGVVTIVSAGGYVNESGTFTYDYSNNYFEITPASDDQQCQFGVEFNPDTYILSATYNGFPQGTLTRPAVVTPNMLSGTFSGEFTHPKLGSKEYALTFNGDGTGSFSFLDGYDTGTFNYSDDNGAITISDAYNGFGDLFDITVTVSGQNMHATIFNNYDQSLVEVDLVNPEAPVKMFEGAYNVILNEYGQDVVYAITFNGDGTGTFSFEGGMLTGTFNYVEENGQIIISNAMNNYGDNYDMTVEIYDDNSLHLWSYCYWDETEADYYMDKVTSSSENSGPISGTFTDGTHSFTFNGDGTGSFYFDNQFITGTFNYTQEGNNIIFSNLIDSWGDTFDITATFTGNELDLYAIYSYDQSVYDVVLVNPDIVTVEPISGTFTDGTHSFTFNGDGTGSFYFDNQFITGTFSYSQESSNIVISNVVDSWGDTFDITATLTDNNTLDLYAVYSYDQSVYDVILTK